MTTAHGNARRCQLAHRLVGDAEPQSYVNAFADRVGIFTLKRQNIGQKSLQRASVIGRYRFARSPLIAIYSPTSGAGEGRSRLFEKSVL